eukprot:2769371-Amphidinium_carterae.1
MKIVSLRWWGLSGRGRKKGHAVAVSLNASAFDLPSKTRQRQVYERQVLCRFTKQLRRESDSAMVSHPARQIVSIPSGTNS